MRPTAGRSIIPDKAIGSGDVVWVPFPFVEAPRLRERPALVIGTFGPSDDIHLLWVLMITSSGNKGWEGDVSLEECFEDCGLVVPCVIRTAKVSTVETRRARRSGAVTNEVFAEVRAILGKRLL